MVHADGFVGKRKVKDRWEDGGFIVESQLEDWPVYKVRCPTSDAKQKPKYRILCQSIYRISDYTRSIVMDETPTRL